MCGYCVEVSMLLNILKPENKMVDMEYHNNAVICLQESKNCLEIINKLKALDGFAESIDLTFCRIWEAFIFQKYDKRYQSLITAFDDQSTNFFLANMSTHSENKIFERLWNKKLYADDKYWDQFISNKELLIENSLSVLNNYYQFWLLGKGKDLSDPNSTAPKDWQSFYAQFPLVYFSFLIIAKYQNAENIIRSIALTSPYSLPDLTANDLWLQRKAFIICVNQHGLQFIFDHYEEIRLELIYYILLKKIFCKSDLDLLKKFIQENERLSDGVTTNKIIECITFLQTTK